MALLISPMLRAPSLSEGGVMLHAWGDESGSDSTVDPGVYLMSAVVVERSDIEIVRDRMLEFKRPGARKSHWRSDSHETRDQKIALIAALPIRVVVVVRIGPTADRDERRRRKCLEQLCFHLDQMGCGPLVLESRGAAADRKDMDLIRQLGRVGTISARVRLGHAVGPVDPRLWIADAVCGAVVASRRGDDRWLTPVSGLVSLHVVEQG